MLQSIPKTRARLIDAIVASARRQRGTGNARTFLQAYFRGVSEADLAEQSASDLAAKALTHRRLAQQRRPGVTSIAVFNADPQRDGFACKHTLVAIAIEDMPFLVDSLNIVFASRAIGVHFIAHPVLAVARDTRGKLMQLDLATRDDGKAHESWQFYEIDRQADAAECAALAESIASALADVRASVRDWRRMREQVRALADSLAAMPPRRTPAAESREARALLEWIEGQHFVFLGYRYYRLRRGPRADLLVPDVKSGLGILSVRAGQRGRPLTPNRLTGTMRQLARDQSVLVLTKANSKSSVHRGSYLDYVAVKDFDKAGEPCGEHRFLGLWTSTAYFASPTEIPVLRRKVQEVVKHFGLDPASHDGKAVLAVLETYPRDELFQATTAELVEIVRGVVNLYERRKTRLMVRRDPFGRFYSCMVYVPRDRYTTDVRQRIERLILNRFGGTSTESQVQISDASHARVHVVVRVADAERAMPDLTALEQAVDATIATWNDKLRTALLARHEPSAALALAQRHAATFPVTYQEEIAATDALDDIAALESLHAQQDQLRLTLHRPAAAPRSKLWLKIIKLGAPIPISDLLPILENFGLRVLSERPYALAAPDSTGASIQDFELELRGGANVDVAAIEARFVEAFLATWRGDVENDGFNRLLLAANMNAREIIMLRAYCRYLLQTGMPFSQANMERVLASHARLAALFLQLFNQHFSPQFKGARAAAVARTATGIRAALDAVTSADDDRILRGYWATIDATLRTNFFQRQSDGQPAPYISFKFDPARVPDLPLPRPKFEIFVYSPRVEGVHLRMGTVARGGLRWSDRREDFRTEVLGLMKAQNVKNTLIVPVGAKGGFFPKRLPLGGTRDAIQAEGIAAYQWFIRGLLDVTDNIVDGKIVPPPNVVRRDSDDPYLVVAADKGTASFSDIANAISVERGFWMGDAFASGGSAGYDHKKMGITAKGGWECVKRHFRELGLDTQSQDFTVVGIGDMAGDVFGNGMLLSPHIRLQAAFNHLHIFLDPAPDAARSFAERERLFKLPRSSWEDYNSRLISRGGGIYPRAAKTLALSSEAQAMLGLGASATPNEVIRAILKMPADLLWNGGIGTYVKASSESHSDARDRSNDALRVDGKELRARVVGEGGNLGFTQRGRVEYALAGGRINTDFIDNSAGVNTSDVEVNLKILLNSEERAGRLRRRDRDRLLASLTDEVASQVLRNNYLQSQAISTLEAQAARRLPELQHLIRSLERSGELNRALEFLPDDETLDERRKQKLGLTRAELAVLLAYSKISLNNELLDSDVPEDPYLGNELERYFAARVRQRFGRAIARHRLRREIIATATTNSLVNRMGPGFVLRAREETGASAADISRAYSIAREVFAMRDLWAAVEALDNKVSAALQYQMMYELSRLLRHSTYWLLRQRRRNLNIDAGVKEFLRPVSQLVKCIDTCVRGGEKARQQATLQRLQQAGAPAALAKFMANIELLDSAWDLAELAARHRVELAHAAQVWFAVGERLGLDWLRGEIDRLNVEGQWQAVARTGLRDAAADLHRRLTDAALGQRGKIAASASVDVWLKTVGEPLESWQRTLTDMRAAGAGDFATLSVGVDALRKLTR